MVTGGASADNTARPQDRRQVALVRIKLAQAALADAQAELDRAVEQLIREICETGG